MIYMYVIHSNNNNKASRVYFLKYDLLDEIIEAVTVTMKHHKTTHINWSFLKSKMPGVSA